MYAWWRRRYKAPPVKPFEQQTIGGLLRLFYTETAIELSRLRGLLRTADGDDPHIEVKIADLEQLFSDAESDLQSLDSEESKENWFIARRTGDPLADKWEDDIRHGREPDLDAMP